MGGQTRERAEGSKIASISCKLVPPIRETDSPLVEFAARFPLSDIYILAKRKLKTRGPRGGSR